MSDPNRSEPLNIGNALRNAGRVVRRRALPLATAAAALGLSGCAIGGMAAEAPAMAPLATPSPQQRDAAERVRQFTSNIDAALDQVDRDRLRAAAEKKAAAVVVTPLAAAPVAVQNPVILASSEGAAATPAKSPVPDVKPEVKPEIKPEVKPLASAKPVASAIVTSPMSSPSAMGAMTAMATPVAETPVPTPTAVAVAATPAEPTVEEALAVLRKKVAAHPTLNTALAIALLDTGDPKAGADLAKDLPVADQKMLGDLLGALEGMTSGAGSAATLAQRAAPLVEATSKWQAAADMNLPKLVLATRVDSFGVYTAVEPKFEQGKRHTVIIYCEVANFSSKKGEDGWFQTRLSQQETLVTEDGLLVWRPNAEEVEDRSMNQRRDFYLVKKLTIPENLAAGTYTLQMRVSDLNGNKNTMVTMPVEIFTK